ncbi:YheC/YheD family protein [Cohnella lubricantis]|uniref:YheC/YheD family protein n=1 Tax=Cohnella lubricantis TaxID=2163172 RepID=A0A841TEK8_9BACL|nr:YheC/YheD family protein [Cohnella lubricantis]MBB6679462.1 YheC/YheD family protein [Cohnella lubricantis]MBP2118199.1 glutathione synthase/RimK-type ligase-like ATP-grasp enzyme [Cohnella lubricantis]
MSSIRIVSKWRKTKILERSMPLAAHLPETRQMDAHTMKRMLDRYGLVYAKPDRGSLGIGVIRIEKKGAIYRIHEASRQVDRHNYSQAYQWIASHKRQGSYLAQRGIRVIRHAGRPVDFRVMAQRNSEGAWEVSGVLARAAHPRKAVTNGSQGGSIHEARDILAAALGERQAGLLLKQFRKLAMLAAARFDRSSPGMNELGLDIAVDRQGRSWILEVNTRPDPRPFKLLRDPRVLRRIVRLGKGYGRVYNLHITKARRG